MDLAGLQMTGMKSVLAKAQPENPHGIERNLGLLSLSRAGSHCSYNKKLTAVRVGEREDEARHCACEVLHPERNSCSLGLAPTPRLIKSFKKN